MGKKFDKLITDINEVIILAEENEGSYRETARLLNKRMVDVLIEEIEQALNDVDADEEEAEPVVFVTADMSKCTW